MKNPKLYPHETFTIYVFPLNGIRTGKLTFKPLTLNGNA